MRLFVLRHAEAELQAPSDAQRPLSSRGHSQADAVAEHLKSQCVKADDQLTIFHSPYLRTTETASIVATSLADYMANIVCEANPVLVEGGIAKDRAVAIVDWLDSHLTDHQVKRDDFVVILVSHQPTVSQLVAWLVNGDHCSQSVAEFPMMPASLAELRLDVIGQGCAELLALTHFDG